MRINATHSHEDRGLDAYWTPTEAVLSLIKLENLPRCIWEPACGDGAIVRPLQDAGIEVVASDICDYGFPNTIVGDFLDQDFQPFKVTGYSILKSVADRVHYFSPFGEGIVTNPPYRLAQRFVERALETVPYVAMYLRLNWLESSARMELFQNSGLTRVLVSSRRLPMQHRHGWDGPRVKSSNMGFCWYVWDRRSPQKDKEPILKWFDWKKIIDNK